MRGLLIASNAKLTTEFRMKIEMNISHFESIECYCMQRIFINFIPKQNQKQRETIIQLLTNPSHYSSKNPDPSLAFD